MDINIVDSVEFTSFLAARRCFTTDKITLEDVVFGLRFFYPFKIHLRNRNAKNADIDYHNSVEAIVMDIKIEPAKDNLNGKIRYGGILWMLALYNNYFYMDAKTLLHDMIQQFNQKHTKSEYKNNHESPNVLDEFVYTSHTGLSTLSELLMHTELRSVHNLFPWPMMDTSGKDQIKCKFDVLLNDSTDNNDFMCNMVKWSLNPYIENHTLPNYKSWRLDLEYVSQSITSAAPTDPEPKPEPEPELESDHEADGPRRSKRVRTKKAPAQSAISTISTVSTVSAPSAPKDAPKPRATRASRGPPLKISWKNTGIIIVFEDLYGNTCNYLHPLFIYHVREKTPEILSSFKMMNFEEGTGLTKAETDDIRQSLLRTLDYAPRLSGQMWINLRELIPIILNCPSKLDKPYDIASYKKASDSLFRRIRANLKDDRIPDDIRFGIYYVRELSSHGLEIPTNALIVWTEDKQGDIFLRRIAYPKNDDD